METVWKAFSVGTLFKRKTPPSTGVPAKELNVYEEDGDGRIALITRGQSNNGVVGFIDKQDFPTEKNKITYNDQFGLTLYHEYEFTTIKDHLSVLQPLNKHLAEVLEKYHFVNKYICALITKSLPKTIYTFNYSPSDFRFEREMVMLPLIETSESGEYMTEIDGKKYVIDVATIERISEAAKEQFKANTIHVLEHEKESLLALKDSYLKPYEEEKKHLEWMPFTIGELFTTSSEHYLEKSKKNYNISEVKTDEYCVAVCAASKNNNGIVGYINEVDDVPVKKRINRLTKGGFGHVFFQDQWFIKPGGSWGMLDILNVNDDVLKSTLDSDFNSYRFIAKILTKIFTDFASWGSGLPIEREILLLPVIPSENENSWAHNKKKDLALATCCYLYVVGQIELIDRRISVLRTKV